MKSKIKEILEKFKEKAFLKKFIDFLKTNWKKVAIIVVALVVASNFFSCGGSEDNEGIKPDHWYHNDLVNYQNCGIRNSRVKTSNRVYVEYIPVCRECHEWDDFFPSHMLHKMNNI